MELACSIFQSIVEDEFGGLGPENKREVRVI